MIEPNNKKEFTSVITIVFSGNRLECETKSEYIKKTKEVFLDDYNIDLSDDDIKIDDVKEIHGRWLWNIQNGKLIYLQMMGIIISHHICWVINLNTQYIEF